MLGQSKLEWSLKMKRINAVFALAAALAIVLTLPLSVHAQNASETLFKSKCAACHGEKGDGKGPLASTFDPKPGNFSDPKFRQGDVDKKITDSITKGKNQMVPLKLNPDEIKAVIGYIKSSWIK
jgi:mono/diheme cytochrome c family protein